MDISNSRVTKAMILAAGEGTRLIPLTLETPKVLLPVAGVPLIYYTLTWLRSHGIGEVCINLHHLGNRIKELLGDGSRFKVKIHYSIEESLLGTAGGVKKVEHFFDTTFVVVYGDVLTDFNLSAMTDFHHRKKAIATLAVTRVSNPWETGIVEMKKGGRIISCIEKPPKGDKVGDMANGGVYVLERQALDFIPNQGYCDFAYDVFPKLIRANFSVYGYVLRHEDYLIDIGTIDKYLKANEDVKSGEVKMTYEEQSSVPG
jgi:NDP-sugar pyrophosphorylase family protein